MLNLLLLLFALSATRAQFHLESMNRCLANCAVCRNDDLTTCSGREMSECVKGYSGVNCTAKQTFAAQITLIDSTKPTLPEGFWQNTTSLQCAYTNSKMEKIPIMVLGMYTKSQQNMAVVPIHPNYQNYIISFNLIRGSWTPFSDSLRIVIFDQYGVELQDYFVEFPSRNEINPEVNLLRCRGNEPKMIEKFQIEGTLDHTKQSKLVAKFEGDIFSGSDWGLTNVKVLFGCSKFLIFDGNDCAKCAEGYYETWVTRNGSKVLLGCEPCPLNCTKCTDNFTCQACELGFSLSNGKCMSKNTIATYPIPGRSLVCTNGRTLLQSSSSSKGGEQKLDFQIKTWPPHREARLIFWVAYIPEAVASTVGRLGVEIDGVKQVEITGSKLKGVESKVKDSCGGFGERGYFSLYKIITPYLAHVEPRMNVSVWGVGTSRLGVWDMMLEYEPTNEANSAGNSSNTNMTNSTTMANNTNIDSKNGTSLNSSRDSNQTGINNNTQKNETNGNSSPHNLTNNSTTNNSTSQANQTIGNQTHTHNNTSNSNNTSNNNNTNNNSSNYNNSNDSSNTLNGGSAQLGEIIRKIEAVKSQVVLGVRLDKEFIITIHYPIPMSKFPHLIVHLTPNTTIPTTVEKQTNNYQELSLGLQNSLLNQKITLRMSNQDPIATTSRSLQQQHKPIVSNLGEIFVNRYDYLGQTQWESINRYSTFFEVLSWTIIIASIILSFLGNSVITQSASLLMQIIFLHVYIHSEYLPTNFKNTIAGLQRMENLDYFTKEIASGIESALLGNVVQQSPPRFTTFNKDINFTRMVYPCVIIFIAYLIWFVLLTLVRKKIEPDLVVADAEEERSKCQRIKLFIIRVAQRYLNFYYQIWQYQYIVFIWAGCIQMHNMSYPTNADRSQVANMIFCFGLLVVMVALPPVTMVYLNKRYFRLDYFQYSYWYENLFFLQLPQESLPSNHHRVLIVVRNVRYIILVVCFAFLGQYPVQALVIIILNHFFSLLYLKVTHLELKPFNSVLNLLEHGLLIALAVTMLVAYGTSGIFHTNQYMVIGHVLTTCCLLLTVVGVVRVFFNGYHKLQDQMREKEISEFKPAIGTERVV